MKLLHQLNFQLKTNKKKKTNETENFKRIKNSQFNLKFNALPKDKKIWLVIKFLSHFLTEFYMIFKKEISTKMKQKNQKL